VGRPDGAGPTLSLGTSFQNENHEMISRIFILVGLLSIFACAPTQTFDLSPNAPKALQNEHCPQSARKLTNNAPPIFPVRFVNTGLKEGWVLTKFDVSPEGELTSIRIIDSSPRGYLEKAATKALSAFKYERSASSSVECNLFTWKLEK